MSCRVCLLVDGETQPILRNLQSGNLFPLATLVAAKLFDEAESFLNAKAR